jgi:hypothetical protein
VNEFSAINSLFKYCVNFDINERRWPYKYDRWSCSAIADLVGWVEARNPTYNKISVIIEEKLINPTNQQAQASLRVCQMLSNSYKDIHLFRFDDQVGDVFILAGDDIQIVVPPTGYWYFLWNLILRQWIKQN